MIERKTNVVMGMLHSFALEATRMKAIEMIANAQCVQEEERIDIEAIKKTANEFLSELEKIPFTSRDIELLFYQGRSGGPI
ncbi:MULTISPECIES: hypothetical protein [Ralstonia]|jgi:hypothetical protein|nr:MULTISPECIES: hypothetical protein [Ralstonia]NPT51754.1 hypothetical protein [Ralstonia sp. 3N]GAQ27935.1 hypothetical protein SAMD00023378_1618 [Ralstonia sp. NT80]HDR9191477.1 hypothetical protein [Burkholderia vietnamiensis]